MGGTPTIVATIASTITDPDNVIELVATDPARPYDPPVWETELSAPIDQADWNRAVADDVLTGHGYRRTGEWWDSSRTTGYQSWTATVDEAEVNAPANVVP